MKNVRKYDDNETIRLELPDSDKFLSMIRLDTLVRIRRGNGTREESYDHKTIDDAKEFMNEMVKKNTNKGFVKVRRVPISFERMLVDMYTLFPTRRLKDYQLMRYTNRSNVHSLNNKYNYLALDPTSNEVSLVFNNYKTKKRYGQQVFNLKKESEKKYDILAYSWQPVLLQRLIKAVGSYVFLSSFKKKSYLQYIPKATEALRGLDFKEPRWSLLSQDLIDCIDERYS